MDRLFSLHLQGHKKEGKEQNLQHVNTVLERVGPVVDVCVGSGLIPCLLHKLYHKGERKVEQEEEERWAGSGAMVWRHGAMSYFWVIMSAREGIYCWGCMNVPYLK